MRAYAVEAFDAGRDGRQREARDGVHQHEVLVKPALRVLDALVRGHVEGVLDEGPGEGVSRTSVSVRLESPNDTARTLEAPRVEAAVAAACPRFCAAAHRRIFLLNEFDPR